MPLPQRVRVIDSHTGGEPTRVVVEGGPDLGGGPLAGQRDRFRTHFDDFRSAVVCEPRGSDVLVGALLVEPFAPDCVAGVIFFNNVGVLGMCGHGTIGVVVTLAHLGRISAGSHRLDTPVGVVGFTLHPDGSVTIENVPSYRFARGVTVKVPNFGAISGDVAWGGNWFFLADSPGMPLTISNVEMLTAFTWAVRQALPEQGISGEHGAEIDHIELTGPPGDVRNHARNFVLCPGKAYDRSPCGTGTSAKVACLADAGKLKPGEVWRQESVIGSVFEASYRLVENRVVPSITGRAWITGDTQLVFAPDDPFRAGIRAG